MNDEKELSVIIPVSERYDDVKKLYNEYKESVEKYTSDYEFIYVLDGDFPEVLSDLENIRQVDKHIKIYKLSKWFGEATALSVGFEKAISKNILTLPAYYQIQPDEVTKILKELDETDMVVARRWPRRDSVLNRFQANVFHSVLNAITDDTFHDLGCGVRAFKREVADEIPIYGDQHRFLPVLASRRGFKIAEVKVEQSSHDAHTRIYSPGIYLRRLLDILTVFFLVKFTKKPLRFFGLLGSLMFIVGGLVLLYLAYEKLFLGMGIGDRPLLLLGSMLFVLGIQIFSIGLIGELIIFTHAKDMKEYTVEEII